MHTSQSKKELKSKPSANLSQYIMTRYEWRLPALQNAYAKVCIALAKAEKERVILDAASLTSQP